MLKKIYKYFLCTAIIILSTAALAQEANTKSVKALPTIKVAMFLEHEGFLMWYAKKQGYDKKLGIDIQLEIVNTNGIFEMQRREHNKDAWDVTAVSSIPFLVGSKDMDLEIIGIANDESPSTSVMVRDDSEILKFKGVNSEYPDVYGSKESVRGKTFLVKGNSSGLYTLASYLDIFDLSLSQVNVKDMEDKDVIAEMKKREVDGAGLWSPDTFLSQQEGYKVAATAENLSEKLPIMFIIDKKVAKDNKETVAKMLAAYMMAVNQQFASPKGLIDDYQEFLKEYTGRDFSEALCNYDLNHHLIFNLDNQLSFLRKDGDKSSQLHKIKRSISTQLMLILKEFHHEDHVRVKNILQNQDYINDEYLKAAKEYLKTLMQNH